MGVNTVGEKNEAWPGAAAVPALQPVPDSPGWLDIPKGDGWDGIHNLETMPGVC